VHLWPGVAVTAVNSANVSTHGRSGLLKTVLPSPKRLVKVLEAMVGNEVSTGLQAVKQN